MNPFKMRDTVSLFLVLLVIAALMAIGARAGCVTGVEGCLIGTTFTNDYFSMGFAQMTKTPLAGGPTCIFTDQFGGDFIDTPAGPGESMQGERREFVQSGGGESLLDAEASTSDACPLKTLRERWGQITIMLNRRQLSYFYDVKGRGASCVLRSPASYRRSGCTEYLQLAWNGCDACPEAFGLVNDCNCLFMTPVVLSLIPGQRFDISTVERGIPFYLNSDGKKSMMASPLDAANVGFLYLDGLSTSVSGLDIDTGETTVTPLPVHTGRNLFGNMTGYENGFKQLAKFDDQQWVPASGNQPARITGPPDGVINRKDGVWNLLRVWLDKNRNGLVDAGEKKTLDELRIETLELTYVASQRRDGDGNRIPWIARYFKKGDPQPYFMTDYVAVVKKL